MESNDADYLLIRKKALYAYSCTYASCINFIASLLDEKAQNVAQREAQIGQFKMMETSDHKIERYIQSLVEGRVPETFLIYKDSFSPDEILPS